MANTFSIEENARESNRLYAMLNSGIRDRLMRYPGVRHVSVGLKITGNDLIWERCFHVYVDEKKQGAVLSKEELIPEVIDGIRTDVHEIGKASPATACEDTSRYRPIKGGISISNGAPVNSSTQFGTLGVIGRKTGFSRCNAMALTNWHVLYLSGPLPRYKIEEGWRVFQPDLIMIGANTAYNPANAPTDSDIGKVVKGVFNDTVDCAIFEVNRSCCNCCGVPYENVINRLETISPLHFNGITGRGRAHAGDAVYFVGAKSGPTAATVVTDSAPKDITYPNSVIGDFTVTSSPVGNTVRHYTGQLKIQLAGTHPCNSVVTPPSGYSGPPYSRAVDHGDSGSLLVNSQNQAVGLLFATDDTAPAAPPFTLFGYANHYDDVIAALQSVGINFEINYSQPSSGGSRGDMPGFFQEPDSEIFLQWKQRVESNAKTRAIYQAVNDHRDEVLMLINHCRPVTVAWHRAKGPAYAAVVADNFRDGKFEYPSEINGISNEQLLQRMYNVLMEKGSSRLKNDLRQFGSEVIAAVSKGKNAEELFASLSGLPVQL
jgi:hypothetical protein